jgi:hypothetical protein
MVWCSPPATACPHASTVKVCHNGAVNTPSHQPMTKSPKDDKINGATAQVLQRNRLTAQSTIVLDVSLPWHSHSPVTQRLLQKPRN